MTSVRVSVFLPTYNHAPHIAAALDSALAQGVDGMEIVIGDDASTDATREIAETYSQRFAGVVRLLPAEPNLGITANCNRILQACRGHYIALFSGDDLWLPRKLDLQLTMMEADPLISFCFGQVEVFEDESGKTVAVIPQGALEAFEAGDPVEGCYRIGLAGCSIVIRADAVPSGGFDPCLPHASDWLFWMEAAHRGRVAQVHEVVARHRRHSNNASHGRSYHERISIDHFLTLALLERKHPELASQAARKRRELAAGYLLAEALRNEDSTWRTSLLQHAIRITRTRALVTTVGSALLARLRAKIRRNLS